MGQGSMEGLAGEVIKLYMIKYQVSSLTLPSPSGRSPAPKKEKVSRF
jgi:hypothetical protein